MGYETRVRTGVSIDWQHPWCKSTSDHTFERSDEADNTSKNSAWDSSITNCGRGAPLVMQHIMNVHESYLMFSVKMALFFLIYILKVLTCTGIFCSFTPAIGTIENLRVACRRFESADSFGSRMSSRVPHFSLVP
ncbi:hypothetical protein M406DRAFT_326598 [Cryphonectria parasitica EP155]|uniref:Uncharacterized protein n=1 Tax=Cryphonectria parasitica (strain ATCC 38755 / EP155) TaxID=660469 RepID=A0A9P4YDY4_CRYP1|nr:uncharacterized protein M406DRAFT_326598 [Cryphonectria parasitica EP155]KAF3771205.1 hypothetical protein M406DRAFT_326598 [Cryphonectria parasitica EP155]